MRQSSGHTKSVTPKRASFSLRKSRESIRSDSEGINIYEKRLADANQAFHLLNIINTLASEPHISTKDICERVTQAIAQTGGYDFVGLLTNSSYTRDEMTLGGWSSKNQLDQNMLLDGGRSLHISLSHPWFSEPDNTSLISFEGVGADTLADLLEIPVTEIERFKKQVPLQSVYLVKLVSRRRLVGLLVLGFSTPVDHLEDSDHELLNHLSGSLGIVLDNKLLFKENLSVLRKMRESNKKLKELDETKDDFISMASHQLRTPLTSIKGYLSMVMEGDAGKISPAQREMLGQAFFSSQRMVYLISDLLNLSRLKTGKFIIDIIPVNLATVVEEETAQLQEVAASRKLKLMYDKPVDFPLLMLDEIKIRQVIMNFIDNALFYTPEGGHVDIKLIEKDGSVELHVTDDGMGVPKSEQPHLFTKFYRAGNARQARPDGTGIGLYMAKKAIVAQSGSIIFESEEGKGSTFGFIFSKHKLALKKSVSSGMNGSAISRTKEVVNR